jgi:hypothetical protein
LTVRPSSPTPQNESNHPGLLSPAFQSHLRPDSCASWPSFCVVGGWPLDCNSNRLLV